MFALCIQTLCTQAYSGASHRSQIEILVAGNYFLGYVGWSRDRGLLLQPTVYNGNELVVADNRLGNRGIVANKTYFPPIFRVMES